MREILGDKVVSERTRNHFSNENENSRCHVSNQPRDGSVIWLDEVQRAIVGIRRYTLRQLPMWCCHDDSKMLQTQTSCSHSWTNWSIMRDVWVFMLFYTVSPNNRSTWIRSQSPRISPIEKQNTRAYIRGKFFKLYTWKSTSRLKIRKTNFSRRRWNSSACLNL